MSRLYNPLFCHVMYFVTKLGHICVVLNNCSGCIHLRVTFYHLTCSSGIEISQSIIKWILDITLAQDERSQ
jgi:hypothetical protein